MSKVAEQAHALGAVALLIGPKVASDLYNYLGPGMDYDTVPTLVVVDEFVSLTKSYLDLNTEVILKADYSLPEETGEMDLNMVLPMIPSVDSVVALSFFQSLKDHGSEVDFKLHFRMFKNYSGCASTDYLTGTDYCLVDPDGNIPGEKLVQEVVRQYCLHATADSVVVMGEYMKNFYENCIDTFDQSCSDQALADTSFTDTSTY